MKVAYLVYTYAAYSDVKQLLAVCTSKEEADKIKAHYVVVEEVEDLR